VVGWSPIADGRSSISNAQAAILNGHLMALLFVGFGFAATLRPPMIGS
jgi:hypothetical protein